MLSVIALLKMLQASGGYWLACSADEIYADVNSIIGSIGLYLEVLVLLN